MQIFQHVIGQTREHRATTPIVLKRERREDNREWRKVFGHAFPTQNHQEQGRRQNQKIQRPFGLLAITEIEGDEADEHRRQSDVAVAEKFPGVVRIPLLTNLGCEAAGGDLHARVLPKQIEVAREVRIEN